MLPSVTVSAVRGSEYPTPRRHSPLCSQRAQISMLGSRSFCRSMGQLWMEFSRGPLKKLTAPSSALLCRSQTMTFLAVTVLRVLIVSVCPHLIIYPWVSEAVFHVFLPLHHFLDGSFLGASAYFTAAILLPSSFIIQMHLKVSRCLISPQGMRPSPIPLMGWVWRRQNLIRGKQTATENHFILGFLN